MQVLFVCGLCDREDSVMLCELVEAEKEGQDTYALVCASCEALGSGHAQIATHDETVH